MSPVVEFSVDENAGSNPLKQFLAGGVQFLGLYVDCDARLGVISWIFLKILCTGKFVDTKAGSNMLKPFSAGGVQLLVLFVNGHVRRSLTGKICRWESR